jgi:hypothetical protein
MFSLVIEFNGEPNIRTAAIDAPGHMMRQNRGFDLVEGCGAEPCTKAEVVAAFVKQFPGVPFRHLKAGIRVMRPEGMTAALDILAAEYDRLALTGKAPWDIRDEMINHPTFAPYLA